MAFQNGALDRNLGLKQGAVARARDELRRHVGDDEAVRTRGQRRPVQGRRPVGAAPRRSRNRLHHLGHERRECALFIGTESGQGPGQGVEV